MVEKLQQSDVQLSERLAYLRTQFHSFLKPHRTYPTLIGIDGFNWGASNSVPILATDARNLGIFFYVW